MATLTKMEDKLGEVTGLAEAAKKATETVRSMLDDADIARLLETMHEEAAETAERCRKVAEKHDGKKTAIGKKARETKREAEEMMATYLGKDADALDGFEFLTMAEAGEVGHWEVLGAMAANAGDGDITALVEWALPIQERHLAEVRRCSVGIAGSEDPSAEA